MDARTVAVYDAHAEEYLANRSALEGGRAAAFAAAVPTGRWRLDLGAGPGLYLDRLGGPVVAGDASEPMCRLARRRHPQVPVVVHDLEALPFRPGALGGVWASKCLQHVAPTHLPGALAGLHRALPVGGRLDLTVFAPDEGRTASWVSDDDLPGRLFTLWSEDALRDLLVGAGFDVVALSREGGRVAASALRGRTLPDVVGPDMRVLVCGLNPSVYAADAGVAYGRPGNRFWPAALAAGLVSVDRDPWHALARHGVGFTDLVKRATPAAAELSPAELADGGRRLTRLVELLQPGVLVVCGVTGWRHAVDRRARTGLQPEPVGGRPVFVMANPSGLNAHVTAADVADQLRAALALVPATA